MRVVAIIGAAGEGRRIGRNKALLSLAGKTVLQHTAEAFERHPQVNNYLVVATPAQQHEYKKILDRIRSRKFAGFASGGAERQDSMHNGLRKLPTHTGIVIFHNVANPLVTEEEITRVIEAAKQHGAAAVGIPAKDTLRRVGANGFSTGVVDRKGVWLMQTPQAIRYDLAVEAFDHASREGFRGTDDVQLVEELGQPVKIVEAHPHNFKITVPEDLPIAEAILHQRREK